MLTQHPLPRFAKPNKHVRGWTNGNIRFGPTLRRKTAHHTHGPKEPFVYWENLYGVKVMQSNRRLRSLIWRTWKDVLTQGNRNNWEAAGLTVTIDNYKGVAKVPNGYQLFTWHHFFNSNLETPSDFPFNWNTITFDLDPPDPYVLPAKPNITGLTASTATGFTVSTDNWPADGEQVCLTSIQRLSLIAGKYGKSRRFTGKTASGTGTGGSGTLTVDPLYPWQDPPTGTLFRVGLRYRKPGGSGDTDPTSPSDGVDAGAGDSAWSAAENICDYNDTVATCVLNGSLGQEHTDRIHADDFEWDPPIPDAAKVTNITAQVMRQEIYVGGGIRDHACYLLKAGAEWGTNKGIYPWGNDQTFPWPYRTYTWDAAALADEWTGADLNDPSFGLSFAGKRTGEYNTVTAVIAHVQMTASYELVGRIPSNPTFYDWTRPPP